MSKAFCWDPEDRQQPLTRAVGLSLRDSQWGHGLMGMASAEREMGFYIDDHIDTEKYGHGHGTKVDSLGHVLI